MTKWVYNFGAGVNDGSAVAPQPARRQGRQPGRNGQHRPARAARLHHHHRSLHGLLRQRQELPGRTCRPRSDTALARIEAAVGRKFGDKEKPLLVSVRSGARVSMPGMMDTVLNLGLNDVTVQGLADRLRRSAFRLGFLSPLHPDVRLRRARRRPSPVRGNHRDRQARCRRDRGYRADARKTGSAWSKNTRRWSPRRPAARSRRTGTTSSGARSAPCSAPG